MKTFDNVDYQALREQYEAEVTEKWGSTSACREHAEKTADYSGERWNRLGEGMDAVFARFAACLAEGATPEAEQAQALVRELQEYITANLYTCTDDILSGLGQMYVCDERFRKNIDRHASGTAGYVSAAIAAYCESSSK